MKKSKIIALILAALMLTVMITPAAYATGIGSLWGLLGGNDVDEENVDGILDSLFGGNSSLNLSELLSGNGLDKIRELLGGAADGASDDALSNAISSLFGGRSSITEDLFSPDILDKLTAMLAGENIPTTDPVIPTLPTTTAAPEESTTVPPETTTLPVPTEPTTIAPYIPPTTIYSGAQTYTTNPYTTNPYATNPYMTTTNPYETSTYQYIPVVSETVTQLVPSDFNPVVNDYDDADLQDGVSGKMILGIVILAISGAAVIAVAVVLKKSRV